MTIPFYPDDVPYVTTAQMVEVDRAMIEDFGIELIQMMENAGRSLAHLARARFLSGDPRGKRVVALAGTGGNGGGALVCARRASKLTSASCTWPTSAYRQRSTPGRRWGFESARSSPKVTSFGCSCNFSRQDRHIWRD